MTGRPSDRPIGKKFDGPPATGKARGFTLVEAVLALAIMTISAAALLVAASRCLAVARLASNYQTAANVLARGEMENPLLPTNEVTDNVVDPVTYDNGFTYSRTVEEREDEEDMFVVRSRVTWSARGREAFEEVSTYLYSTNHN